MSEPVSEVKNGGYASSSEEEESKAGQEGFRKDGEPDYKPRKASSSDSDSSADGADEIDDDETSSESYVASRRKGSNKSEVSEEAAVKARRHHSSSSDTDDHQDELSEDEDEVMKNKLEEDKKLDILNDNQELSREEIELSKRQTIAMDEKEELNKKDKEEIIGEEVLCKSVVSEDTKEASEEKKREEIEEEPVSVVEQKKLTALPSSSCSDEEDAVEPPASSKIKKSISSSSDEQKVESPTTNMKKSLSSSNDEDEEILGAAPASPKRPMSSSEDEPSIHKRVSDDEIQMKDSSSSSDDEFVHVHEKDVMKSPSSASEDSIKVPEVKPLENETVPPPVEEVKKTPVPSSPHLEEQDVIKTTPAPVSEKVVLRAETPERIITSPKPPTSPKPSHIPRVNNNNGDITKIYTEALNNDSENNNKNASKVAPAGRSKPSRDITEIYKNSILAKEATPPSSPRTPRNKPVKDITSLYTDKIDKPVHTSPSEKLCPKKHNMATSVEKDEIRRAYEDVRSDTSDTQWAVFKFEGNKLGVTATGNDFNEFKSCFGNEDRGFGYIRIMTGDEMSKRSKFVLVTWVGPQVSVMKKAKMSTDKALMKDVIQNLSVELQLESHFEFNHDHFKHEVDRASGARYGTGVRDL